MLFIATCLFVAVLFLPMPTASLSSMLYDLTKSTSTLPFNWIYVTAVAVIYLAVVGTAAVVVSFYSSVGGTGSNFQLSYGSTIKVLDTILVIAAALALLFVVLLNMVPGFSAPGLVPIEAVLVLCFVILVFGISRFATSAR